MKKKPLTKKQRKEWRKVGPAKKVGKITTQRYVWEPTGENAKNLEAFLETEEDKRRKQVADLEFLVAYLSGLRSGILAAKGFPLVKEEHVHALQLCIVELKSKQLPLSGAVKQWHDQVTVKYKTP